MQTLNDLMSFGHVVYSNGTGVVIGSLVTAPLANEVVYQMLDSDGQCVDDEIHDLYQGWELLRGFTGQYGYNGPVMHPSEFIGGRLEDHIRDNAGYYVAVAVEGMPEDYDGVRDDEIIGWAVAFKESGN